MSRIKTAGIPRRSLSRKHLSSFQSIAYDFPQDMATSAQSGNENAKRLNVFLCHSSADKALVRELCVRLESDGVQPWLDEKNLLGGQDFQQEIRRAVRASDVVVICLSTSSTTKSGFVQREIKYAMELAEEQPEGAIFLIPLRLEECNVPQSLSKLHWIDYFKPDGYQHLRRALDFRAQALKKNPTNQSGQSNRAAESQPVDVPVQRTTQKKPWLVYAISLGFVAAIVIAVFQMYREPLRVSQKPFLETRTPQFAIGANRSASSGSKQVIKVSRNDTIMLRAEVAPGDFVRYKVLILGSDQEFSVFSPRSPDGTLTASIPPGTLKPGDHSMVVQGVKRNGQASELSRFAFSLEFSD
jgi:hypothetical protein